MRGSKGALKLSAKVPVLYKINVFLYVWLYLNWDCPRGLLFAQNDYVAYICPKIKMLMLKTIHRNILVRKKRLSINMLSASNNGFSIS